MIKKIESVEQYENLMDENKSLLKNAKTNAFIFPSEVNSWILSGSLYYKKRCNNLFLYNDLGRCYRLYYYIDTWNDLLIEAVNKPIIINHVVRKLKPIVDEEIFTKCGFKHSYYARKMEIDLENTPLHSEEFSPEINVRFASPDDIHTITQIWWDGLKDNRHMIPTEEQLKSIIKKKSLMVVEDSNVVKGAIQFVHEGNSSTLDRIAIDKECRGKRIGEKLVTASFLELKKLAVQKQQVWVINNNAKAIRFYEKLGYITSNRFISQLILD